MESCQIFDGGKLTCVEVIHRDIICEKHRSVFPSKEGFDELVRKPTLSRSDVEVGKGVCDLSDEQRHEDRSEKDQEKAEYVLARRVDLCVPVHAMHAPAESMRHGRAQRIDRQEGRKGEGRLA